MEREDQRGSVASSVSISEEERVTQTIPLARETFNVKRVHGIIVHEEELNETFGINSSFYPRISLLTVCRRSGREAGERPPGLLDSPGQVDSLSQSVSVLTPITHF